MVKLGKPYLLEIYINMWFIILIYPAKVENYLSLALNNTGNKMTVNDALKLISRVWPGGTVVKCACSASGSPWFAGSNPG